MSEIAIKVDNISKKYNLLHKQKSSKDSLTDVFISGIKSLINKNISLTNNEEFWALKEVSFEINKGDRVGIIGRNGAGKSTLLKILSRIVKPTTGRIEYDGRMASLLEVGTGFHGDLSGRENIYLNGSILGMSKSEIDAKFDEIVAFSEVEQFLDTPVKRYSSGMYVRLGFSIAAHLNPEILIVDEVLAVGDSVFQKKCIDKMTILANEGRTILFVSHNFATINALCDKAILLEKGRLIKQASVKDVFNDYYQTLRITESNFDLEKIERFEYKQELIIKEITFSEIPILYGNKLKFSLKLKSKIKGKIFNDLDFGINFCDNNYNTIYHFSNRFLNINFSHTSDNELYVFESENNLKPGVYNLILFLRTADEIQDFLINKVSIEILDGNPYGYNDTQQIQGMVLPNFSISKLK
jgi:lipopolysaccharide transport system ATP-binding protein